MLSVHCRSGYQFLFPVSSIRFVAVQPGRHVVLSVDLGAKQIEIPLTSSVHAVREAISKGHGNLSAAAELVEQ